MKNTLSKGHISIALYAVLKECGFLTQEDFAVFERNGSGFSTHETENMDKGIEITSGSLGYGVSIGIGCALAAKRKRIEGQTGWHHMHRSTMRSMNNSKKPGGDEMLEITNRDALYWSRLGMRKAYGDVISRIAQTDPAIVCIAADLANLGVFRDKCPQRYFNAYRKNAPKELESYLEMLWAFAEKRGKGAEYERALYGAAFFAMQTVITNYFYHPKCPLKYCERKNECEKYFQKKYFAGVYDAFPLNEIKRNHRIKMILLKKGKYFWVRALRDIYLSVHRQTCYD